MSLSILVFLFFLVAFVYSTVGHGGASGYLALMVLAGFSPDVIRPTALLLNIIVSAIAAILFYQQGFFRKKIFFSLIILSIPLSIIGALIHLPIPVFKIILGLCLLVSVLRILIIPGQSTSEENRELPLPVALLIGGCIGLISGLIGIGGGILLSPLLIIFRWANIKESAAIAAPFILVNSIAGLSGLVYKGISFPPEIIAWTIVVTLGGLTGSYWGSSRFNTRTLRYLLALVLILAAGKLFIA